MSYDESAMASVGPRIAALFNELGLDLAAPERFMPQGSDSQSFATAHSNNGFLARNWAGRKMLTDSERDGFVQYFYTAICTHLEAELTLHLEHRISYCKSFVQGAAVIMERGKSQTEREDSQKRAAAVRLSLYSILDNELVKAEKAPLNKLCQLYGQVFGNAFEDLVGSEIAQDIQALGSIRNLFSHGRDFYFEFEGSTSEGEAPRNLAVASHSLQMAARRLQKAGILPEGPFDRSNHAQVREAFYGDGAMLYFYRAVRQSEEALGKNPGSPAVIIFSLIQKLPDLS